MTQDSRNRFEPLLRKKGNKSSTPDTTMLYFVNGLKFCNANISGFRGNILELLAFLDAHQPHFVAIQTLTAQLQLLNCSQKHVCTVCTER